MAINNSDLEVSAQKSLDLMMLLIALAYKWEKKEVVDAINKLIVGFAKSLNDSEKIEYSEIVKKLGLMEYGDKI